MDASYPLTPRDSVRESSVLLYERGTPFVDIRSGLATPIIDLTPYATSVRQTSSELSFSVAWHLELYGATQPTAGMMVCVFVDLLPVFVGIIDAVNDYREAVGERRLGVTCRSRDANSAWREFPRVTDNYPQSTRLDAIIRTIARSLGLTEAEIILPNINAVTPHASTQLANVSAWQMLESLLVASTLVPFMDSLGRLSTYSKDTSRRSDIELAVERLLAVTGSRSRPAVTRVQVQWLDPNLTRVEQQDRVLDGANITAGFFQSTQEQDVWFSSDRTQRARDTRLVVVQTAGGPFNAVDERYEIVGPIGGEGDLHGRIVVETEPWVHVLLGYIIAARFAPTLSVHANFDYLVMIALASIGTGVYEIWGVPFDFVNARNTSEAYSTRSSPLEDKLQVISCDYVSSEGHAQTIARIELLYGALSSVSYGVEIVDDLRIQRGDILELPDESRLFVTDFDRDLTYGAPAVLRVQGFRV